MPSELGDDLVKYPTRKPAKLVEVGAQARLAVIPQAEIKLTYRTIMPDRQVCESSTANCFLISSLKSNCLTTLKICALSSNNG